MKQPHKHAELIKAWADGTEIDHYYDGHWFTVSHPFWREDQEYRIKPEPKPDVVQTTYIEHDSFNGAIFCDKFCKHNIKLIFDGETGKLKSAEVL